MILQPSELFKLFEINDTEESKSILSIIISFLLYMKTGDILKTSNIIIEKIGTDVIKIDSDINKQEIIDSLQKNRVIKLPI